MPQLAATGNNYVYCIFRFSFLAKFCLDLQRYHSKNFPYLALRDYTGAANGRYHLISSLFIGDDSEMGGAESVFFLNKISKGAAVTRVSLKGLCSIIVNV